jgi:hypothetical protein
VTAILAKSAMKSTMRSKKTKRPTRAGRRPSVVETLRECLVPILRDEKKRGVTAGAVTKRFFAILGKVYGEELFREVAVPHLRAAKGQRANLILSRRELALHNTFGEEL